MRNWFLSFFSQRLLFTNASCTGRYAAALEFLCFTHIFLACETNHNNHFILFCYATAMVRLYKLNAVYPQLWLCL
jgi:hypothetical protein